MESAFGRLGCRLSFIASSASSRKISAYMNVKPMLWQTGITKLQSGRQFSSRSVDAAATEFQTIILVEKMMHVSDGLFLKLPATQYGPQLLRLYLVDNHMLQSVGKKSFELFGSGQEAPLESVISSDSLRAYYLKHKFPVPGSMVQHVSDKMFRPFRQVQHVEGQTIITQSDPDSDATFSGNVNEYLTGCPVDRRVALPSGWTSIQRSVQWMWARGHLPVEAIGLLSYNGSVIPPDSVSGSELLKVRPDVTLKDPSGAVYLGSQAYVKGKYEFEVKMPSGGTQIVALFVNENDVVKPQSGSMHLWGSLIAGLVICLLLFAPKPVDDDQAPGSGEGA
jgi:hypothetical protein